MVILILCTDLFQSDFKIKKARLRGIESFGMLCAQHELGLGEDASGLWELPEDAEIGCDLVEFLELDDNIIEVDTPEELELWKNNFQK